MGRKKKRRRHYGSNIHHIFPTSRFHQWKNEEWNQTRVNIHQHELYHALFFNRTPQEIIQFLSDYFWKGHIEPPPQAFQKGNK